MNHRQLWKKIFGDNDAYIDFYFKERADHTVVYSKYEGHDLVSMIFFNYYTLVIQGEKVKCPYIEGKKRGSAVCDFVAGKRRNL